MITITIDWFNNWLTQKEIKKINAHPQGNGKWKNNIVQRVKGVGEDASMPFVRDKPMGKSEITYYFYFPCNKRRDTVNYMQMCKSLIDGFVRSGLLSGDHWQVLKVKEPVVEIDRDNPRIEFRIEERKDNDT